MMEQQKLIGKILEISKSKISRLTQNLLAKKKIPFDRQCSPKEVAPDSEKLHLVEEFKNCSPTNIKTYVH